ncbi:MAG: histidine phosphatase family protein [Candidatus Micrarchaeaceae archaeon]
MRLIVVRHGQTEHNAKKLLQGHVDGPLNEVGMTQAKELALKLKDEKIDVIFSSDLMRAKHTTKEIAAYHRAPVFYVKDLREQNYGIFQLMEVDKFLSAGGASGASRVRFRPQGGESLLDLKRKVGTFVDGLYEKYEGKTIIISAHAGVVWCIYAIYAHVPLQKAIKMQPKNTGVLVVGIDKNGGSILDDNMFESA